MTAFITRRYIGNSKLRINRKSRQIIAHLPGPIVNVNQGRQDDGGEDGNGGEGNPDGQGNQQGAGNAQPGNQQGAVNAQAGEQDNPAIEVVEDVGNPADSPEAAAPAEGDLLRQREQLADQMARDLQGRINFHQTRLDVHNIDLGLLQNRVDELVTDRNDVGVVPSYTTPFEVFQSNYIPEVPTLINEEQVNNLDLNKSSFLVEGQAFLGTTGFSSKAMVLNNDGSLLLDAVFKTSNNYYSSSIYAANELTDGISIYPFGKIDSTEKTLNTIPIAPISSLQPYRPLLVKSDPNDDQANVNSLTKVRDPDIMSMFYKVSNCFDLVFHVLGSNFCVVVPLLIVKMHSLYFSATNIIDTVFRPNPAFDNQNFNIKVLLANSTNKTTELGHMISTGANDGACSIVVCPHELEPAVAFAKLCKTNVSPFILSYRNNSNYFSKLNFSLLNEPRDINIICSTLGGGNIVQNVGSQWFLSDTNIGRLKLFINNTVINKKDLLIVDNFLISSILLELTNNTDSVFLDLPRTKVPTIMGLYGMLDHNVVWTPTYGDVSFCEFLVLQYMFCSTIQNLLIENYQNVMFLKVKTNTGQSTVLSRDANYAIGDVNLYLNTPNSITNFVRSNFGNSNISSIYGEMFRDIYAYLVSRMVPNDPIKEFRFNLNDCSWTLVGMINQKNYSDYSPALVLRGSQPFMFDNIAIGNYKPLTGSTYFALHVLYDNFNKTDRLVYAGKINFLTGAPNEFTYNYKSNIEPLEISNVFNKKYLRLQPTSINYLGESNSFTSLSDRTCSTYQVRQFNPEYFTPVREEVKIDYITIDNKTQNKGQLLGEVEYLKRPAYGVDPEYLSNLFRGVSRFENNTESIPILVDQMKYFAKLNQKTYISRISLEDNSYVNIIYTDTNDGLFTLPNHCWVINLITSFLCPNSYSTYKTIPVKNQTCWKIMSLQDQKQYIEDNNLTFDKKECYENITYYKHVVGSNNQLKQNQSPIYLPSRDVISTNIEKPISKIKIGRILRKYKESGKIIRSDYYKKNYDNSCSTDALLHILYLHGYSKKYDYGSIKSKFQQIYKYDLGPEDQKRDFSTINKILRMYNLPLVFYKTINEKIVEVSHSQHKMPVYFYEFNVNSSHVYICGFSSEINYKNYLCEFIHDCGYWEDNYLKLSNKSIYLLSNTIYSMINNNYSQNKIHLKCKEIYNKCLIQ